MKRNNGANMYGYGRGQAPVEVHIRNGAMQSGNMGGPFNNGMGVSKFDGGLLGQIGIGFLGFFISLITLGLGTAWATCMMYRWYARHTRIDGRQVIFDGKGIQLLGCYIKWGFLTIITLGIYSFWLHLKQTAWVISHTHLV